jgi:SNF2 family DNA or RNA helicase
MRRTTDLRPYQQRVATFLYEHDEALCAARMGAGKTAAALTAIGELQHDGVIRHALVLAPKRVARVVWPDEIGQWAHTAGLSYAVLDGSPARRLNLLQSAPDRNLTIIGLDLVHWLLEKLTEFYTDHAIYDLLVIDEISRLRSPNSKRATALAKYAHHWRMIWGLSGTLRPNSAQDLFMPARVVTRGKLWGRSFYQWRKLRFYPVDYHGYDWQPLPGAEERINAEIAPHIVSVSEDELPRQEPIVVLDRVELPPRARIEYDQMQERLIADVEDKSVLAVSAAVATGKLAQMANGFIYDDDDPAVTHDIHDEKREWLMELIGQATAPTLLIYEYREDLAMIQEVFDGGGIPYLGAGVSDTQTQANIRDWNDGKLPFMALHPRSGGHGLNLQFGGCDMAWIAPTWSPELWEQTIARLLRPGQRHPVIVRVCVANGTVDDMKLDRVHRKMSAQAAFEAYLGRASVMDHPATAPSSDEYARRSGVAARAPSPGGR